MNTWLIMLPLLIFGYVVIGALCDDRDRDSVAPGWLWAFCWPLLVATLGIVWVVDRLMRWARRR